MGCKAKYTDTELIKGIERGLENEGIMDRLGVASGSRGNVKKRLDKLRETHGTLAVNMPDADGINYGKAKAAEFAEHSKVDVDGIMQGIENKNKALQEKSDNVEEPIKRKPAIMNKEFEEAVQDMENNFMRQAELRFKGDMDSYASNTSKLKEKMDCGEIIDLADITEYNKVVDKYGGAV